jgi:putative acetyltransferase
MIRRYRPADLEELLGVWAAASVVAHPFLDEGFLERERRRIPELYLPQAETWVSEEGGHVIGFLALLKNEVGALFVDPRFHRLGIGRALLDQARAARGALEVEVFRENAIGRAFYRRYGFVPIQEKTHEETGFPLLRLRLPSDPSTS